MKAIYIPQLAQAHERTQTIEFKENLKGIETLTPVQGSLKVTHQGNYLEVSAQADTIVTLSCHRCLQQFNHRLSVAASELIWLADSEDGSGTLPFDQDLSVDDLVESLPPNGSFEPTAWLYEQLCLAIPQKQLCDQQCTGIEVSDAILNPGIDRRWASLESLKGQLPS
ncbi:metal-binding protein [Phormidesmis priestleyi ULC007]|uniref:Metal-binding protein n=1 Tax=Phormidesmis priestleyi ULC007 TaxID=1920490 RepID=A0A2T1D5N1_9CYAN|nr:YceD family protein [Phormidesmis priestleyi]PSB15835.1 metal-binding protein [Phormidesmis priestleyi ULC007]PZO46124.1 MAG: metal-binding protein [Phormidesmis priestleyi]